MATINDAVIQITEASRFVNDLPSFALSGGVHIVSDAARLAQGVAEYLLKKENLRLSTLILLAEGEPLSWVGGGMDFMHPSDRTLVYTELSEALTEHIEALHKKRHTYQTLGLDDSCNLAKLENLLQKIAERNKVILPERILEKNPTTRNYVPVDWSGFLQCIAKA